MPKNDYSDNLKKGIILVFVANLINLLISLANGFVLPKFLSVETYADIKTFQLYSNYIGVLALGYSDGLYLQYGGKKLNQIPNKDVNIWRTNLFISQGIMSVLFLIIGILVHDKILFIAALTFIPVNIASAFKNVLQATGEFKAYSKILNYTSILTFVGTIILLFIIKTDNSIYYVLIMAAVTILVWILLERKMITGYGFKIGLIASFPNFLENVKSGIVLMLGNFSSILMTSIDRWFVKFLLSTSDFAYYSFVVSTEHLIAIFINPVVSTMYNYICVTSDMGAIKKIKKMCLIFSIFLVSSAFPAKFILEVFLRKYIDSQYVLFILFSTEILFMVIKGIYVNIYKARKRQDVYLKQLVFAIILGCILNGIFYALFHSNEGIAFATLLSVASWYVLCSVSVKEIRPDIKEIIVLIMSIVSFITCGFYLNSIIGFVVYISIVIAMSLTFMRQETLSIVRIIRETIIKKIKK